MKRRTEILDRLAPLFPAPDVSYEALLRRGERKRRNSRITAAVVALLVAFGGFGLAIRIFDRDERITPVGITTENVQDLEVTWSARLPATYSLKMAVQDGGVYVMSGERLFAFSTACGSDGTECQPTWTGGVPGRDPGVPIVGDQHIYVVAGSTLYAFSQTCGSGAHRCLPLWTWTAPRGWAIDTQSVSVAGGFVYAGMYSLDVPLRKRGESLTLNAWRPDCQTDGSSCNPVWQKHGPGAQTPVEADGVLYVLSPDARTISAMSSTCGFPLTTCAPNWTWTSPTGTSMAATWGPVVGDGAVWISAISMRSASLQDRSDGSTYVFAEGCGTGGQVCQPLQTVPSYLTGVSNGFVFLARPDTAYTISCATDGSACSPVFAARWPDGTIDRVSPDGRVVYVGAISGVRISAYASSCLTDGDLRCATPMWTSGDELTDWIGFMEPTDGLLLTSLAYSGGPLLAYAEDCGTAGATCAPVWSSESLLGNVKVRTPVIDDGAIYFTGPHRVYALAPK